MTSDTDDIRAWLAWLKSIGLGGGVINDNLRERAARMTALYAASELPPAPLLLDWGDLEHSRRRT